MFSVSEKKFSLLFSGIVLAELVSGAVSSLEPLHFIFKPLIVIALLLFFWLQSKTFDHTFRIIIAFALLFSLLGDTLLLFVDVSQNYFLLGLVAFLLAHVMYVTAFLKDKNKTIKPYGFIILLLVYACGLFYLIKDGLQDMFIPVVIYMIVILGMSTSAFLRRLNTTRLSFIFVFLGALLFMVSDSILAVNRFYKPIGHSNISIMLTYALAQYFIIIGILKTDQVSR